LPITVSSVAPGSAADTAGILKGAIVMAVNGAAIDDPIDFMFASSDMALDISFVGADQKPHEVTITRTLGEPIGLSFEPIKPRICSNKCIFCFVDQMPKGLRPSLCIKDEDYRLSFLFGNFITATNLSKADLSRIENLHLSPLYVSVHATDPRIRVEMLGNPNAPPVLPVLERLVKAGITLHTQIVLCPGINDGEVLERTVSDLALLFPGVQTVAIVPVGLTKFRAQLPEIEPVSPEYAAKLIQEMRPFQAQLRERLGRQVLLLSDEFYLMSSAMPPEASEYGAFEQIENGVGIVAAFLAEIDEALDRARRDRRALALSKAVLLTGKLASPIISQAVERLNRALGTRLSVAEVRNEFFGESVTVAGLLVGQDIGRAISEAGLADGDIALIPDVALEGDSEERKGDSRRFIDGITLGELKQKTGATVLAAPVCGSEFVRFLEELAPL